MNNHGQWLPCVCVDISCYCFFHKNRQRLPFWHPYHPYKQSPILSKQQPIKGSCWPEEGEERQVSRYLSWVERKDCAPLVYWANDMAGKEARAVEKRLASALAKKWKCPYSQMVQYVRCGWILQFMLHGRSEQTPTRPFINCGSVLLLCSAGNTRSESNGRPGVLSGAIQAPSQYPTYHPTNV